MPARSVGRRKWNRPHVNRVATGDVVARRESFTTPVFYSVRSVRSVQSGRGWSPRALRHLTPSVNRVLRFVW